jgi:ribulose-phosphate 3-epimerase
MEYKLIPAILTHTIQETQNRLSPVENLATTVQVDIMDGILVPDTTIQPDTLFTVSSKLSYEFHMMVAQPETYLLSFKNENIHTIILHIESSGDISTLITQIKILNKRVGLAISPETPLSHLEAFLHRLDMVLVMTVHPGKDGQQFMPEMLERIEYIRTKNPTIDIEVDGGINEKTLLQCKKAGANRFVVGSALYHAKDITKTFKKLERIISTDKKE